MKSIVSKVSYLRGLAEGLDISKDSNEGKIMMSMLEVLESMSQEMEEMKQSQLILQDYVDTLDQDFISLQEDLYEEDDDLDFLEDFVGVECPNCDETIYIDKDAFHNKLKVACPNCQKDISLEDYCNQDNFIECKSECKNND
ncbi:CD1247 N-terminal domain-containing protein [Clostridium oceanicum]|uniref:Uncharacterized protein n=1 Tax=Clostridium oceanicum TaxID=1543 RepID=A0ABN1JPF0_9CLOT